MRRLTDFLAAVKSARWRDVPPVWDEQLRAALSDNLVRVGWGGVLELTDTGRAALAQSEEKKL